MTGSLTYLWLEAKRQWRNREILIFRLGLPTAEERANGWLRQLRTTPLRPSVAVAAKVAVAMSFALPAIALVAAAGGMVGDNEGLTLGWARWLQLIGLMWLATTPITAIGALIGLTFGGEAAQGATTLAFIVLWLAGGIFTPPSNLPDVLAAVAKVLPSYGVVQVGESVTGGHALPASALVVLAAWTLAAGTLAALAWRRVVAR